MTEKLDRLRERAGRYFAAGNIDACRAVCESMLAISPNAPTAHLLLSDCAVSQDRHRRACEHALASAAGAGSADWPRETLLHLAMRLFSVGEYQAVVELIRASSTQRPKDSQLLVNWSQQLRLLELHAESLAMLEAAVAMGTRGDTIAFLKGNALKFLGRFDLAIDEYESCLALNPQHSGAHWSLANLGYDERSPTRIARIRRLLERDKMPAVDETYLSYALFKELDGQDDTEGAWAALQRGARLKRAMLNYDRRQESTLFAHIARTFAAPGPTNSDSVAGTASPIFIVGMPRTGTTLLERIIGGHPDVTICGELNDFRMQFKWATDHYCSGFLDALGLERSDSIDYRELGRRYLEHTRWRVPQTAQFTDKHPDNFLMVGLILRALPGARIIHMQRNPMDACFSNFKELFGGNAHAYSYDFSELAAHHGNYRQLMAHWHRIAPDRILDVSYEDLVCEPDRSARRVMAYCGLGYDANQLQSESNPAPVSSASSVQVRQPIHRNSVGGWQRYATQLEPLQALLSDANSG